MASLSGPLSDLTEPDNLWLLGGVLGLLSVASVVGWVLAARTKESSEATQRAVANLNARLRAWWVIVISCTLALLFGRPGVAALFGFVSFLALREFVALISVRAGDRVILFWVTCTTLPLQYWLAVSGWRDGFAVLIPVGVFTLIPVAMAMCGEAESFLERAALILFGWMTCVFGVSHASALLALPLPGEGPRVLALNLLAVQLSDVSQYLWGKALGHRKIAPRISPNKTWEGFVGGVGTATAIGAALSWVTPFSHWQAAGMSLIVTLLGFAGGLVMSAIKRDRGVKDYGTLIQGHGGVLDRVDSVCFSAPVFYYLTRTFFT